MVSLVLFDGVCEFSENIILIAVNAFSVPEKQNNIVY